VEMNPIAAECARRGRRMLLRNKSVKCPGAAERLHIIEGDVLQVIPTLKKESFDRILAPRPLEGKLDSGLGKGDDGIVFLKSLLPLLKDHGECHWYDFAADHELPRCDRIRGTIQTICDALGYEMEIICFHHAGSVAKRQVRICADFRIIGRH